MKRSLYFESLLTNALADWPKSLKLDLISFGTSNTYSVRNLGELYDAIDEKYINNSHEVLQRNLNKAIYIIIHSLAPTISELYLEQLRHDVIRLTFEKKLKEELESNSNLNWSNKDVDLANLYFEVNFSKQA